MKPIAKWGKCDVCKMDSIRVIRFTDEQKEYVEICNRCMFLGLIVYIDDLEKTTKTSRRQK